MRTSRRLLLAPTVLCLGLLAGCSGGDDEDPAPVDPESPTAAESEEQGSTPKIRKCKVDVEIIGAIEASWTGKGRAIIGNSSGPPAFYQASEGDIQVSAYAEGEDFVPSVVIASPDGTFSTEPGADGLQISPKGKGAEVDAAAVGVDPESPDARVAASFDC